LPIIQTHLKKLVADFENDLKIKDALEMFIVNMAPRAALIVQRDTRGNSLSAN
jgi:hypothetical protein